MFMFMAGFVATEWGTALASKGANSRGMSIHLIFSGVIPSSNQVHQKHQPVKSQSDDVVQPPYLLSQPQHLIHLRSDFPGQPTNGIFQTLHLLQQPMDNIFQWRHCSVENI